MPFGRTGMTAVQERLFNMGSAIADILESEQIPYMIAFGTLLGAVRHEGFIPWDDDFDFQLFENSYDSAIAILRERLPKEMFLEDEHSEPLYFHGWAHVKDLLTDAKCELFPQDNQYAHTGLSVDLYRVESVEKGNLRDYLENESRAYFERKLNKGFMARNEYEAQLKHLEAGSTEIMGEEEWGASERDEIVFGYTSIYKCKYYEVEQVLPLAQYKFEGRLFWGPADADTILRRLYGDYAQLPPVEKRNPHYSSVEFLNSTKEN